MAVQENTQGYVIARLTDIGRDILHRIGQSLQKQLGALAASLGDAQKALGRDLAKIEAEIEAEKAVYKSDIAEEKQLLDRVNALSRDIYRQTQTLSRFKINEEKYHEAVESLKQQKPGSAGYREQTARINRFKPAHDSFTKTMEQIEKTEKEMEGLSVAYQKKARENRKYQSGQGWGKGQELGVRTKNLERLKERQKQLQGLTFLGVAANSDRLVKELSSPQNAETLSKGLYNAVNKGADGALGGAQYNGSLHINEWERVLEEIEKTIPLLISRLDLMTSLTKFGYVKKDASGKSWLDMSRVSAADLLKIALAYLQPDITGTTALALKNLPKTVQEDPDVETSQFEKNKVQYGGGRQENSADSAMRMFTDAVASISRSLTTIATKAAGIVLKHLPASSHYGRIGQSRTATELAIVLKKLFALFETQLKMGRMMEPRDAKRLIRQAIGGAAKEDEFDIIATVLFHIALEAFCTALKSEGGNLPMVDRSLSRAEAALADPESHLIACRRILMARCVFLREQPDYGERQLP